MIIYTLWNLEYLSAGMFETTQDLGIISDSILEQLDILNKAVCMTPSLAATNTAANEKTSAL